MNLDETVIKILIIVIPGIITMKLLSILRNKKYKDVWNDILNIIAFSFIN